MLVYNTAGSFCPATIYRWYYYGFNDYCLLHSVLSQLLSIWHIKTDKTSIYGGCNSITSPTHISLVDINMSAKVHAALPSSPPTRHDTRVLFVLALRLRFSRHLVKL